MSIILYYFIISYKQNQQIAECFFVLNNKKIFAEELDDVISVVINADSNGKAANEYKFVERYVYDRNKEERKFILFLRSSYLYIYGILYYKTHDLSI